MDNEEPHFVQGFLANLTLMLYLGVDQARGTRLLFVSLLHCSHTEYISLLCFSLTAHAEPGERGCELKNYLDQIGLCPVFEGLP